jgi:hypothetical protein
MKEHIKKIIKKTFPRFWKCLEFAIIYKNKHIKYSQDGLWSTSRPYFLEDRNFTESYNIGRELIPKSWDKELNFQWRAYIGCWFANIVKNVPGDFIECGTNTGMYARMIINYSKIGNTEKKIYLIDTFEGLDEKYSTTEEMERSHDMGYHKVNIYESVKKTFSEFKNVEVIKGVVPDVLERFTDTKFCYVSIDMNSVYPEISALEKLWDKISVGGVIVLDDYGIDEDQGLAHNKFAESKNATVLCLPTGQGVIIKTK